MVAVSTKIVDVLFPERSIERHNQVVLRRLMRNAVGLLFLYRAVAEVTAAFQFASTDAGVADHKSFLEALAVVYALGCLWVAYRTCQFEYALGRVPFIGRLRPVRAKAEQTYRFGLGRHGWLDDWRWLVADLGVAVGLNVLLAAHQSAQVGPYEAWTELFAPANIGVVALWTGLWGGRRGLLPFAIVSLVELLKAPIAGAGFDFDWVAIGSRTGWLLCGMVVASGVTRTLETTARRIVSHETDQETLRTVRILHDDYKVAVLEVARALLVDQPDVKAARAAVLAVMGEAQAQMLSQLEIDSVEHAAQFAGMEGARVDPTQVFWAVNDVGVDVRLENIAPLRSTLRNLVSNAARNSPGARVSVRWSLFEGDLQVTVMESTIHPVDADPAPFDGLGA